MEGTFVDSKKCREVLYEVATRTSSPQEGLCLLVCAIIQMYASFRPDKPAKEQIIAELSEMILSIEKFECDPRLAIAQPDGTKPN